MQQPPQGTLSEARRKQGCPDPPAEENPSGKPKGRWDPEKAPLKAVLRGFKRHFQVFKTGVLKGVKGVLSGFKRVV